MHELGIVFHVIDDIEALGRENDLTRVSSVTLELGEVSGVVPSLLQDAWHWAADRSDLLRGSELVCEATPAVTLCDACGRTYGTVEHGRTCPYCGSGETHLLYGREMTIKQIEAC
jgi:hydrogenase nickel incorporation protein HypA/HybF